jgi:hypothetical protein
MTDTGHGRRQGVADWAAFVGERVDDRERTRENDRD